MGGKDQKPQKSVSVEELSSKLDLIIRRLDALEELIVQKPEYEGLVASLRLTKVGLGLYEEPLKVAARLKSAERFMRKPNLMKSIYRRLVRMLICIVILFFLTILMAILPASLPGWPARPDWP